MKGSAFEPGLSLLSHYTGYVYAGTKPARASLPRRSEGGGGVASHTGVFRRAHFSSLPTGWGGGGTPGQGMFFDILS